jgi:dienelactone hydrolase
MHHLLYRICIALAVVMPISADAETLTFRSVVVPSNLTATLTGSLSFPAGTAPFPVVILLHPCGGLEPFGLATLQAHARSLQDAGFATLILDSYGPRNLNGGKACDMFTLGFRSDDAFNAMATLKTQPKISSNNIFVLGLSDGANAALVAAKGVADAHFSAAVAYYPGCATLMSGISYAIRSPTLVFVAGKDDWTPPSDCISAKSASTVTGAEFDVINYPNAHHGFDQQRKTIRYKGHTLAYSPEAASDSRIRVREFFIRYLTDELKAKAPFSSSSKAR